MPNMSLFAQQESCVHIFLQKKEKRSCFLPFMVIAYLFEASLICRSRTMKNKLRMCMSSFLVLFCFFLVISETIEFIYSPPHQSILYLKAKFEQERQQSQNNEVLKVERTRDTAIVIRIELISQERRHPLG